MFSTWVSIAEAAILDHHNKSAAGRGRAVGPRLAVEVVQRAEHLRTQPLSDAAAGWWARLCTVLARLFSRVLKGRQSGVSGSTSWGMRSLG
eukprot:2012930-Pyramimonas_sp.AAC.1